MGRSSSQLPDLSAYPPMLTISQVAEVLGYSTRSTKRRIHDGELTHVKDGRLVRVPREALLAYMSDRLVPARVRRGDEDDG